MSRGDAAFWAMLKPSVDLADVYDMAERGGVSCSRCVGNCHLLCFGVHVEQRGRPGNDARDGAHGRRRGWYVDGMTCGVGCVSPLTAVASSLWHVTAFLTAYDAACASKLIKPNRVELIKDVVRDLVSTRITCAASVTATRYLLRRRTRA